MRDDESHDVIDIHLSARGCVAHRTVEKVHATDKYTAHAEDPKAVVMIHLNDQRLIGFQLPNHMRGHSPALKVQIGVGGLVRGELISEIRVDHAARIAPAVLWPVAHRAGKKIPSP